VKYKDDKLKVGRIWVLCMKAYSNDLRQKIIDAYNNKEGSYRKLAQRFSVTRSFIQKLMGRYQDTGRVSALPHGGGQKSKLNSEQLEILQKLVSEKNDATLDELCEGLKLKTSVKISRATMGRILQNLQLTRKKNLSCK